MAANVRSENVKDEVAKAVDHQMLLGELRRRGDHSEHANPAADPRKLTDFSLEIGQGGQGNVARCVIPGGSWMGSGSVSPKAVMRSSGVVMVAEPQREWWQDVSNSR